MASSHQAPDAAVREIPGPTSPHSTLLGATQRYLLLSRFTLESGVTLSNVPVAFKTWGRLDPVSRANALVVCHALTGSADVEDWWGPLLGPHKLFDPTRFLIVCCNVLGSPYGSASSCTAAGGEAWPTPDDGDDALRRAARAKRSWTGDGWWGPEFPATTTRDDVRIQKRVLDYLGVESVAAVVGGSMGGMAVLEWPLCFPTRFPPSDSDSDSDSDPHRPHPDRAPRRYIRCIVPIATSARHSAWCISWAEAQRQSIYSDPAFKHGYYHPAEPPRNGLGAARMAALLTYRSRDSFESRFGRRVGKALKGGGAAAAAVSHPASASASSGSGSDAVNPGSALPDRNEERRAKELDAQRRRSVAQDAAMAHNEGNKSPKVREYGQSTSAIAGAGYFVGSNGNGAAAGGSSQNAGATSPPGPSLEPTATTPPVPAVSAPPSDLSDEALLPPSLGSASTVATTAADATRPSPLGRNGVIEAYSPSSQVPRIFSAQSYLRYQGDKFVRRFDANCYIHLTRKMDSHDVAKGRWGWRRTEAGGTVRQRGTEPRSEEEEDEALARVLDCLSSTPGPGEARVGSSAEEELSRGSDASSSDWIVPPKVLVVSIESDGLFAPPEQKLLHALIAGSEFVSIVSPDGHDGFLLEFEQINAQVGAFLRRNLEDLYAGSGVGEEEWRGWKVGDPRPGEGAKGEGKEDGAHGEEDGERVKESVFGEVEDVTRW